MATPESGGDQLHLTQSSRNFVNNECSMTLRELLTVI